MAIAAVLLGAMSIQPVAADPNCKCRLAGERYDLGTVMCIRGKLSRCEMFLNNTSWKTIAESCPEASLSVAPVVDAASAAAGRAFAGHRIAAASR